MHVFMFCKHSCFCTDHYLVYLPIICLLKSQFFFNLNVLSHVVTDGPVGLIPEVVQYGPYYLHCFQRIKLLYFILNKLENLKLDIKVPYYYNNSVFCS